MDKITKNEAVLGCKYFFTSQNWLDDGVNLALYMGCVVSRIHWISLSTWDLGLEEIRAISDFAL